MESLRDNPKSKRVINRYKRTYIVKRQLHEELFEYFKKKALECRKEPYVERLHSMQKPNVQVFNKKSAKQGALLLRPGTSDNPISDLVSEIQFSKLKITADPKIDCNINRGMATLNCYDNIPRQPITDIIEDGNSLESSPDLTQKMENVSIECDTYEVNNSACNAAPSDIVEQTVSLKIDTNVRNHTNSQVLPMEQQNLVNLF